MAELEEKRNEYLDEMENEIQVYEAQNKTGKVALRGCFFYRVFL